jgi:hypothetical protein
MLVPQLAWAQSADITARPGSRWWWLGSAVDTADLRWNMRQYAQCGIGTLEITPIYGVQGNDNNNISFLSPKWMEMLRFVMQEAKSDSLQIDMNCGTGWPFGGPSVPIDEAACKAVFTDTIVDNTALASLRLLPPAKEAPYARFAARQVIAQGKNKSRVIALFISRTRQKVKRAAPGGEGWVLDHFDRNAVAHYLQHISKAFDSTGTPYPNTFFNDSYEVYEADWTPSLLDEFEKRRGYRLQDHFDRYLANDPQTLSDYRETLGDLLLENFTEQWTAWAHAHGAKTRNQAHGSPANLIDCYAAVDIPEIEGFGLTHFGIKGLRQDEGNVRENLSDFSMLKYAPSAAHITGKPLTSSETFTWLTEHFRTSLSQLKPDMDLMFCAGVNRMLFHGTAYSPKDDPWPGWKFYASIDMSPTNSIWRDAPSFMQYVTRCQERLQSGRPDNDFLIYLPIRDIWKQQGKKPLMQFSIDDMGHYAPAFKQAINSLDALGYDCDYISDRYLLTTDMKDGKLTTAAGQPYRGLIIPEGTTLTPALEAHIANLKANGARVIMGIDNAALAQAARSEELKTELRLKAIRRTNDQGHFYFMANLTPNDVDQYVQLAVDEQPGWWYNPLNGEIYAVETNGDKIRISLRSGESMFLQTLNDSAPRPTDLQPRPAAKGDAIVLDRKPWTLSFIEEAPKVAGQYKLNNVQTWETLGGTASSTMGTGVYETTFKVSKEQMAAAPRGFLIDLGDVRESARVYINGEYAGCAWSVPFLLTTQAVRQGNNTIRIEVTNLPANRIAELDRRGVNWRKFNEINIVNIHYQKSSYANWAPMKSGLNSDVRLLPLR